MDRMDIQIRVLPVKYQELTAKKRGEPSAVIRQRVVQARQRQRQRLAPYGLFCNAQMNHALLQKLCPLTDSAQQLLAHAFTKLQLSARSYDRIIKVARTIADLGEQEKIDETQIAEALQLRNDMGRLGE